MLGLGYLGKEANYKLLQTTIFLPVSVAQLKHESKETKDKKQQLALFEALVHIGCYSNSF